jgi:hypothetical protein
MIWLVALFLIADKGDDIIQPFVPEACAFSYSCRGDNIVYDLVYQGSVLSTEDLTQEECEALKAELEAQTIPFTELECRPTMVERQKS